MSEKREFFVEKLRNYYRGQNISADEFNCKYKNDCAVKYRGAEAYVGEKYGESFRVLVASLDLGNAQANLKDRFERIKGLKQDGLNPHMKGTLEILKVIFSKEKADIALFDNFAMTNTAKCCLGENMSQAPWKFFENCKEYTMGEVDKLDPDIIVTQGECASAVFELLYPELKSQDTWSGEGIKWHEKEGAISLKDNRKVGIICSIHPAVKNNKGRSTWKKLINERLPNFMEKWRPKIGKRDC